MGIQRGTMTTNSTLISSQPADAVGYTHCFNCGNTRRSRVRVPGEGMLCKPCAEASA
jgi:formylmethanofuran dehydrogenase subunit E